MQHRARSEQILCVCVCVCECVSVPSSKKGLQVGSLPSFCRPDWLPSFWLAIIVQVSEQPICDYKAVSIMNMPSKQSSHTCCCMHEPWSEIFPA